MVLILNNCINFNLADIFYLIEYFLFVWEIFYLIDKVFICWSNFPCSRDFFLIKNIFYSVVYAVREWGQNYLYFKMCIKKTQKEWERKREKRTKGIRKMWRKSMH